MTSEDKLAESYNNLIHELSKLQKSNASHEEINEKLSQITTSATDLSSNTYETLKSANKIAIELKNSIDSSIEESSNIIKKSGETFQDSQKDIQELVEKLKSAVSDASTRDTTLLDSLSSKVVALDSKINDVILPKLELLEELNKNIEKIDKFNKASRAEKRNLKKQN
tara:strand:+ start:5569 stop:6072 length:504 start_codon:yes stop_codon:yes gene_type:complete